MIATMSRGLRWRAWSSESLAISDQMGEPSAPFLAGRKDVLRSDNPAGFKVDKLTLKPDLYPRREQRVPLGNRHGRRAQPIERKSLRDGGAKADIGHDQGQRLCRRREPAIDLGEIRRTPIEAGIRDVDKIVATRSLAGLHDHLLTDEWIRPFAKGHEL